MLGNNLKRTIEVTEGRSLKIQEIFLTIQGEGPYAGRGAVFVRLGGCNLACKFCDTEFDSFVEYSVEDIIENVKKLSSHNAVNLVVISGGEPFRQSINKLCEELLNANFQIQIESNGTLYQKIPQQVEIVCSPKSVDGKYYKIRPELISHIIAYKFLVSANLSGYTSVPEWDFIDAPIYVQPINQYSEELNTQNNILAVDIAIKKGYILSCQIHKMIGVK